MMERNLKKCILLAISCKKTFFLKSSFSEKANQTVIGYVTFIVAY